MKCILLTEEERKRIVRKVKPRKDSFASFQYLNLLSAVSDEENEITLTRVFFRNDPSKKAEEAFSEVGYILLGREASFSVFIREYLHGERYRNIKSPCPELVSDSRLLEMIKYYNGSYALRTRIEKKSDEYQKAYYSFYRNFTDMYLNREYFKHEEPDDGKNPVTRTRPRKTPVPVRTNPPEKQEKNEDVNIVLVTAAIAIVLICLVRIINSIT